MITEAKLEASVCPTCGGLLAKGVHKQIEAITREIEAVSQTIRVSIKVQ